MIGPYFRLGFGKWGILGEHDVTQRKRTLPAIANFRQSATYGQIFWAPREWLVPSLIAERLTVARPFREDRLGGRLEVAARLTSEATLGISTRVQRDFVTGRYTRTFLLQIAMKTLN